MPHFEVRSTFSPEILKEMYFVLNSTNGDLNTPVSEKTVISTLNNLLAKTRTRTICLQLLYKMIPYCSHEALSENVSFWLNCCLGSKANDSISEAKLNLIIRIVENSSSLEFFNKQFSAEYLGPTVKACCNSNSKRERVAGLKCLTQCMKKFPVWFGNYKRQIQEHIFKCLENADEIEAETAAICFMQFLQTGPSGVNGTNYITSFDQNFENLCVNMQSAFSELYRTSHFKNIHRNESSSLDFPSSAQDVDGNKNEAVVIKRMLNILTVVKEMIRNKYCVEKRIRFKNVLEIIQTGLSTHICFTEVAPLSNRFTFLKEFQKRLLKILRILIIGYLPTLLPFAVVIESTLLNLFTRIHQCDCLQTDRSYKIVAYKTLIRWLSVSKSINESFVQQKYIDFILKDILPNKNRLLLMTNDASVNRNQKVTKNKLLTDDNLGYQDHCIYALEALQKLLERSFSFDEELLKTLISSIITLLTNVQIGAAESPYNNPACESKLYETAASFLNLRNVDMLPSMHLLINLFHRGRLSSHSRITNVSTQALDFIERLSYPVCPTGQAYDSKIDLRHDSQTSTHNNGTSDDEHRGKDINILSNILINVNNVSPEASLNDSIITIEDESDYTLDKHVTNSENLKSGFTPDKNVDSPENLKAPDTTDIVMETLEDPDEDVEQKSSLVESLHENSNTDLESMCSAFHNIVQN